MNPLTDDTLGAFCRHTHVALKPTGKGPLSGLTMGVKDLFDIAGHVTGCGQPDWLRTHGPAERTAPTVQRLLDAGAEMVGKTHTDEIAYSLNGENAHYGTPVNPRAPGRIPGGSSSGSAAATAGKLVDFGLGSDTGGSVRLPASYCGIFGFRPSHGRVSLDGAMPLADSFDTAGWFTREAALLKRIGEVLLGESGAGKRPRRMLVVADAFALAGAKVEAALKDAQDRIGATFARVERVNLSGDDLGHWMGVFRTLQGAEVWGNHGAWIRKVKPSFGPGIRERLEWTSTIKPDQVLAAAKQREEVAARVQGLLGDDAVLCLPTGPGIAPLRNTPTVELEDFRGRALSILCIAGLSRLPQVNLPAAALDVCPLGLSLVGQRNADLALLALAEELVPKIVPMA